MEILKEFYNSHQQLSKCSVDFLKYVEQNAQCCQRSCFNFLLSDKRFDYFQSQPWPTFINKKTKKEMEYASIEVHQLITSIPERLFSFNITQMSEYYEINSDLLKILIYGVDKESIHSILGRGDFILSNAGGLKCVEFNMQANLGGWELDMLEPLYLKTPVISEFLSNYRGQISRNRLFPTLLKHLIGRFLEKHTQSKTSGINIAIVYNENVEDKDHSKVMYLDDIFHTILKERTPQLEGKLNICRFKDLRVVNRCLFFGTQKIDIVIEMVNGLVPFPLLIPVKEGNLMMYNGPITRVMSNKLNLALLSENSNSDLFSLKDRKIIENYIPWTRKVKIGETTYENRKVRLEDFIISQRELLVLKPSEGICGKDVYMGCTTSPELWKHKVEQALLMKNWVIQEYVPSLPFLYQNEEFGCSAHYAIWGLFTFGAHYGGGFVRILPEANSERVINTAQGAEESIILEIEE